MHQRWAWHGSEPRFGCVQEPGHSVSAAAKRWPEVQELWAAMWHTLDAGACAWASSSLKPIVGAPAVGRLPTASLLLGAPLVLWKHALAEVHMQQK